MDIEKYLFRQPKVIGQQRMVFQVTVAWLCHSWAVVKEVQEDLILLSAFACAQRWR